MELYRTRHLPVDHPGRRAMAEWIPSPDWIAAHPEPAPATYPISDDGPSWREGVDRAMAGDVGDDDDW